MLLAATLLIFLFKTVHLVNSSNDIDLCDYYGLNDAIKGILCAVETKQWFITSNSSALVNAGCLIGKNRCKEPLKAPSQHDLARSPPPPDARNKKYQELATIAEKLVPKAWFRDSFADERLHLSHGNDQLPRKQFDATILSNKKLKNIYQCVTRQQFMRRSYDFHDPSFNQSEYTAKCRAMENSAVIRFKRLWDEAKVNHFQGVTIQDPKSGLKSWVPNMNLFEPLLISASETMEYFYTNHGGIWTGCFAYEYNTDCRGALAAASMVIAMHSIYDIAGKQRNTFTESLFVKGYILSSLGRHLLHGDFTKGGGANSLGDRSISRIANRAVTSFRLQITDFIALQAAYLKLYINSFGKQYSQQLNTFIPMTYHPGFDVYAKNKDDKLHREIINELEPVYSSLRNWMFTECSTLIDFGPYRPMVASNEFRNELTKGQVKRRVLIDIGANGFFASPKYLLDSYAVYLPFTDVIMVEPEPHFSASIPPSYTSSYNIKTLPIYAEVGTNNSNDMLKLLPTLVTKDDFVVLKFDVDPNRFAYGPTMEWGLLFSLMQNQQIAELVDEVYIELHFHFPSLYWKHYHSNWEALDAIRFLRKEGAIVHSWP